ISKGDHAAALAAPCTVRQAGRKGFQQKADGWAKIRKEVSHAEARRRREAVFAAKPAFSIDGAANLTVREKSGFAVRRYTSAPQRLCVRNSTSSVIPAHARTQGGLTSAAHACSLGSHFRRNDKREP